MKGMKLYLIGTGILLMLYLAAEYYKPKATDWRPSYLKEDKIPFGLFVLNKEYQSIFPETRIEMSRLPVYNTLKDKERKNTNYLIIAGAVHVDELDYKELVKFMKAGNHVFIATFNIGEYLKDTLKLDINSSLNYGKKKSVPINFVSPAVKAKKPYVFDKGLGDLYFSRIDTSRAKVLGRNEEGEVNFVKYTFGEGALYVLPNPQLLSNYALLNPEGAAYAAKALSYLPVAETLIWDENNTKGNLGDESLLRVLFRHDQLRWAYYLSMISLVIFVFFEMKRRQRIIPIIPQLRNSSVDFVRVVGKVYYEQRDNSDIASKKISYLLEFIRATYRLKTNAIDEDLMAALVSKSGGNESDIRHLFATIEEVSKPGRVTDHQLITLNKLIEKFYKQAQ
ncbi:DUF4350 domain-containing protein [Pedobacter sp. KBW06]|uniref:DUF4350 domain-containing protein n=1 Tax=Pedobacter sp. KBW06 TaxID=2153359 RepID=UPI000F5900A8|nr:DUF4350 domain-containing protein [Pedobacter sp. KBW06]RQO72354.1 DUF4350 domain-containing protein [Pedobacter sp. KBW06]